MRANTHIGEASAQLDGATFMFRPTLANIADIGTPAEIVEVFAVVMSEPADKDHAWQQIGAALNVLYHCADEFTPELERLLGHWVDPFPRRYHPGKMPAHAVIDIARQMLRHGVVGVTLQQIKQVVAPSGEYMAEFKAAEMAAMAAAHLGVTIEDAWRMTMTSIVQILAAKFPPDKNKSVTVDDLEKNEKTVNWLKRVNAARKEAAKNG